MPEAVIVSAARTPIGRANKGSLKDFRPDDLSVLAIKAALDKVPELDPTTIDDLMLGCGLPGRRVRQQHGPSGRHAARLRPDPRHHDHAVLLVLGADLADGLPRDQGRGGRRVHLRRRRDGLALRQGHLRPPPRHPNPRVRGGRGAHRRAGARAGRTGTTPARTGSCRTSTSRWARRPRTWPGSAASTARSSTSSGSARRTWPRRRSTTGSGPARSPRSRPPTASVVEKDDGPRAGVTYEAIADLKPVFRPDGVVTAGNCCPLNDGAAAVIVMSDTRANELGITPLARIVSTGRHRPVPRDHGPRPGRGHQAGPRPTPT